MLEVLSGSVLENLQGQKLHNLSVVHLFYHFTFLTAKCKDVLHKNDEMPNSSLLILQSYSNGEEKRKVSPSSQWCCWKPCRAWWWCLL